MDKNFLNQEFDYVANKLELSSDDLKALLNLPRKTYRDYKNKRNIIRLGASILRKMGLEREIFPLICIIDYGVGNVPSIFKSI